MYVHVYVHTFVRECDYLWGLFVDVLVHIPVRICGCAHVCVHVYVCVYACVYVCACVFMRAYVRACVGVGAPVRVYA